MCVYTTWVNFKLLYMATIIFFGERGNSLKVNKTQSTKSSIQICIKKKKAVYKGQYLELPRYVDPDLLQIVLWGWLLEHCCKAAFTSSVITKEVVGRSEK